MTIRKTAAAVIVTSLLVGALAAVHARRATSLRVSMISASGDYRVKVQNASVLPVYVRYCVKDAAARQGDLPGDERIEHTVQRKRAGSAWEIVNSDLLCDSVGMIREGRLLWRGQYLYTEWFHPNMTTHYARPERNFDSGDTLRFLLYLHAPDMSSGIVTSPEFTLR